MAASLIQVGRTGEALPLIDECLQRAAGQLIDPEFAASVVELRLMHFAQTPDAADCRKLAETWEQLGLSDPDSLYKAACLRAVTAAVIRAADPSEPAAQDANAEADRAMDWLQKAAAGYKNAAQLAQDKDLEFLRTRVDFQRLHAALAAGQKNDPK
jgi:hypothetical protein